MEVYDGRRRENGDGGTETGTFLLRCRCPPSAPHCGLITRQRWGGFMSFAFTYSSPCEEVEWDEKGDERYLGCDAALFGPLLIAIAHCPPLSILPPSTCCKEGQPYQGFYRCNKINGNNNNSVLSFLYILDNYVTPIF